MRPQRGRKDRAGADPQPDPVGDGEAIHLPQVDDDPHEVSRQTLRRKVGAGETELAGELSEGAVLLGLASVTVEEGLAAEAGDREGVVTSSPLEVDVDRVLARFGSW